jgi:RNA polymerase-binding transcription factor DksA
MATKKPAAKPAKKAAPAKKVATKPVKKSAPVKKVAKPAPKSAKPAPKPVAKKPVVKKPAAKPVAKKATPAPVKKAAPAKKAVVVKPVAKKAAPAPAKKAAPAPAKKAVVVKPVAKKAAPAPAKKVVVAKPTPAPVKKVAEVKKPAPAPAPVVKERKQEPAKASAPKAIVKPNQLIKASVKNPKDIKIPAAKPVALPKINTKTSRTYQPDFTKSVLDQQKNDPGAPMARYSDNELMEFKELIYRKLEAAKKELNYLQGLITRKDETGGDESENRYMTMEDGSLSMEREQLSQMASRQITFIDHLEKALMRIENKTYGVCRVTGKLIDKARLRAVPHATLSIEAKMGIVK